jgi:integrase
MTHAPTVPTAADVIKLCSPAAIPYRSLVGVAESARAKIRVSAGSLYGDNRWSFEEELRRHETRHVVIAFDGILLLDGTRLTDPDNVSYLSIYKELMYSFIADPPPSRPKLSTIVATALRAPRELIRFMHANRISRFGDVSPADLGRFLDHLVATPNSRFATKGLSMSGLRTRAEGLRWIYLQRNKVSDGLSVDPWEGQSIETWAATASPNARAGGATKEMPDEVARALVQRAIMTCQACENYLKARDEYRQLTNRERHRFDWTKWGFKNRTQWAQCPARTTAAAYIIIAMFSGMRVNEVLAIRLHHVDPDSGRLVPCTEIAYVEVDGMVRRCYFLHSKTKKLAPEPELTKWQVAPIVFQAVAAVIEVRKSLRTQDDFLFASRSPRTRHLPISVVQLNWLLRQFVATEDIRWNRELWGVQSHQFRKKFARLLIRQGLGWREIQDQLKHIDIEMTKRYGSPDLHVDLHEERFLLSKERYEELLSGSLPIIGGGAGEIEALRVQFKGKTREDRERMLQTLSRNALIDAVDLGLCLYNAKRALCCGNRVDCKPAECLNSAVPLNTAIRLLRIRQSQNEHLLEVVKSPLTRIHILRQQETTLKLLDQATRTDIATTEQFKHAGRHRHVSNP